MFTSDSARTEGWFDFSQVVFHLHPFDVISSLTMSGMVRQCRARRRGRHLRRLISFTHFSATGVISRSRVTRITHKLPGNRHPIELSPSGRSEPNGGWQTKSRPIRSAVPACHDDDRGGNSLRTMDRG